MRRALALLLGAVALAGCGLPRLTMTGDSITAIVAPYATADMSSEYRLDVSAHNGARIDQILPYLTEQLKTPPAVAVVNVGTNDAVQGYANWRVAFDQVVAQVASVPCVVFVTVAESTDAYDVTHSQVAAQINAAIAETGYRVADWNAVVLERGLEVSAEGIHPTIPVGAQTLADLIEAQVATCPA